MDVGPVSGGPAGGEPAVGGGRLTGCIVIPGSIGRFIGYGAGASFGEDMVDRTGALLAFARDLGRLPVAVDGRLEGLGGGGRVISGAAC